MTTTADPDYVRAPTPPAMFGRAPPETLSERGVMVPQALGVGTVHEAFDNLLQAELNLRGWEWRNVLLHVHTDPDAPPMPWRERRDDETAPAIGATQRLLAGSALLDAIGLRTTVLRGGADARAFGAPNAIIIADAADGSACDAAIVNGRLLGPAQCQDSIVGTIVVHGPLVDAEPLGRLAYDAQRLHDILYAGRRHEGKFEGWSAACPIVLDSDDDDDAGDGET